MRSFILLMATCFGPIALSAEIRHQEPIIINDPEWPPFFFAGKNPTSPGFGKDVLSHCLKEMDLPHTFKYFPIERMKYGLKQGDVDVNIYSLQPGRSDFLHFGKVPLFELAYHPVVLAGSNISIKAISDFDRYRLGHQLGFFYSEEFHRYVEGRKKNGTLDETHSNESNFQKLLANRIDIFISTTASIGSVSKAMGITDKIKVLDFEVSRSQYYVSLSKKSPRVSDPVKFLDGLDNCVLKLKSSGKYCQMAAPYGAACK